MYPILFKIGNITIYSYGFILYVDILISLYLLSRFSNFFKINFEKIFNSFLIVLISMFLGGRIGFAIFSEKNESLTSLLITIINPWEGGLTIIGAIFFSVIGLYVSAKIYKVDFWKLADLFSFVAPFSVFLGRIACLFAGCCYGKESSWGIFLHGAIRYPTQIMESLLSLILFFYFLISLKNYKENGKYLLDFILFYGLIRLFVEFFRSSYSVIFGLSWAQIFSILMIIIAMLIKLLFRRIYSKIGG